MTNKSYACRENFVNRVKCRLLNRNKVTYPSMHYFTENPLLMFYQLLRKLWTTKLVCLHDDAVILIQPFVYKTCFIIVFTIYHQIIVRAHGYKRTLAHSRQHFVMNATSTAQNAVSTSLKSYSFISFSLHFYYKILYFWKFIRRK